MSSKPSASYRGSSKKKFDAIATTQNTTLYKRRLRVMDRSMKKITRLLKSPERPTKISERKSKTSPRQNKSKIVETPVKIIERRSESIRIQSEKSTSSYKTYPPSSKCISQHLVVINKRSSEIGTLSKATIIKSYCSPTKPNDSKIRTASPITSEAMIPQKKNQTESPITEATVPQKSPKTLAGKKKKKKAKKNIICEENTEYYPNKMKRINKAEKVMLKPKHELTTVHSLNKRKRFTPQKEMTTPLPSKTPQHTDKVDKEPKKQKVKIEEVNHEPKKQKIQVEDLSVKELVIKNDAETLTDEDLMEILTCPSPVWWEDPPDDDYSEEPILQVPQESAAEIKIKQEDPLIEELQHKAASKVSDIVKTEVSEKSTEKPEKKYFEKRSVLENLLSNLRTKKDSPAGFDDSLKSGDNNNFRIKDANCNVDNESATLNKSQSSKKKCISESSDLSDIRDDDILKDLENINIPMENMNAKNRLDVTVKPAKVSKLQIGNNRNSILKPRTEFIVLDDVEKTALHEPGTTKSGYKSIVDTQVNPASIIEDKLQISLVEWKEEIFKPKFPSKGKVQILSQKTLVRPYKVCDQRPFKFSTHKIRKENRIDVPNDLPPLKKFPKVGETKIGSPTLSKNDSFDSDDITESSSLVSNLEMDTISDTNIKFIMDDEAIDGSQTKLAENNEIVNKNDAGKEEKTIKDSVNTNNINGKSGLPFLYSSYLDAFKKSIEAENCNEDNPKEIPRRENAKPDSIIVYKIMKTDKNKSEENNKKDPFNKNEDVSNKSEENKKKVSPKNRKVPSKNKKVPSNETDKNKYEENNKKDPCNKNEDASKEINEDTTTTRELTKNVKPYIINYDLNDQNHNEDQTHNDQTKIDNKKNSITKLEIGKTYKALTHNKLYQKENLVLFDGDIKKPDCTKTISQCNKLLGLCTCQHCTKNTVFGIPTFFT